MRLRRLLLRRVVLMSDDDRIIDTVMLVLKNFHLYDHGYDEDDLSDIATAVLAALRRNNIDSVLLPNMDPRFWRPRVAVDLECAVCGYLEQELDHAACQEMRRKVPGLTTEHRRESNA